MTEPKMPEVERAWSVPQGARIVLELPRECSQEQCDAVARQLKAHWPDVDVVVLAGVRLWPPVRELVAAAAVPRPAELGVKPHEPRTCPTFHWRCDDAGCNVRGECKARPERGDDSAGSSYLGADHLVHDGKRWRAVEPGVEFRLDRVRNRWHVLRRTGDNGMQRARQYLTVEDAARSGWIESLPQ